MNTHLEPDSNIPSYIYEIAASHGVGIPLKRQRRRFVQIFLFFELLFVLALLGWFGYNIYGYIAFTLLSHAYPNINSVPDNQLDTYFWLQNLHDNFWLHSLQIIATSLIPISKSFPFFLAYRTRLYICTDGLLKIYRGKEEAIRWNEVKELITTHGKVTGLVKRDGANISLPQLLMSGRDKSLNTLIIDKVKR